MDCRGKFYTYENYPINYIKIHKGECPHCNCGPGVQNERHNGENEKWTGPFDTYQASQLNAARIANQGRLQNAAINNCKRCKPN